MRGYAPPRYRRGDHGLSVEVSLVAILYPS